MGGAEQKSEVRISLEVSNRLSGDRAHYMRLNEASIERSRTRLYDPRAKLEFVCDRSGEHLLAIQVYPKHFIGSNTGYTFPGYGYRLFNFLPALEQDLMPKCFKENSKGKPLDYLYSRIVARTPDYHNSARALEMEKFHRDRNTSRGETLESHSGHYSVTTEPLGTFYEWFDRTVMGSKTVVTRSVGAEITSVMNLSLRIRPEERLIRKITIEYDGKVFTPVDQSESIEFPEKCRGLLRSSERAIRLFIAGGLYKTHEYLSMTKEAQALQALEPENFSVTELPKEKARSAFVSQRRFNLTVNTNEINDILNGEKLKPRPRTTFLQGLSLRRDATNDIDAVPFIAQYGSRGPISITLSPNENAPGVFIGKRQSFPALPWPGFLSSKSLVKQSFLDLTSDDISRRVNALKNLGASGFNIEVATNSWDLEIVENIKRLIDEQLLPAKQQVRWRVPCTPVELLDATMNFLRGRQSLVVTNAREADYSFHSLCVAVDKEGYGTVKLLARAGVGLLFDLPRFKEDQAENQNKFVKGIVSDFSISPPLVLETLFREGHLIEDHSIWAPGGEWKWTHDPANWSFKINPRAASTFKFVSSFYEFRFDEAYDAGTVKITPFAKLFDPYATALPEKVAIKATATNGGSLEYEFTEKGLVSINVFGSRWGFARLFGATKKIQEFSLQPSKEFHLMDMRNVVGKTLGLLTQLTSEQVAETKMQPLLDHLSILTRP